MSTDAAARGRGGFGSSCALDPARLTLKADSWLFAHNYQAVEVPAPVVAVVTPVVAVVPAVVAARTRTRSGASPCPSWRVLCRA